MNIENVDTCISITKEQKNDVERNLILKSRSGDISSRNKLIEIYLNLVRYIANKYKIFRIDTDELVQEGVLAIIDAIKYYNLEMNTKFSTFVYRYIEKRILEYAKYLNCSAIKVPNNIQTEIFKLNNVYIKLKNDLQREPTEEEIISNLNCNKEKYVKLLNYKGILEKSTSIDEEEKDIGNDDFEKEIEAELIKGDIYNSLKSILTNRELKIIVLRYGLKDGEECTYNSIGQKLGISKERVVSIEKKALLKLRKSNLFLKFKDN